MRAREFGPDGYLEVPCEKLVQGFEGELRRVLCRRTAAPRPSKTSTSRRGSKTGKSAPRIRASIRSAGSLEPLWKSCVTPQEWETFLSVAGNLLRDLGYVDPP